MNQAKIPAWNFTPCYDEGVSCVFLEASYVPGTWDVLPCNSYLKRKGGEWGERRL